MTKAANDAYSAFFRLPDSKKWTQVREALDAAGPAGRSLASDLKHAGGVWHTDTLFDHARPTVLALLALGWVSVDSLAGEIRLTPWGELLVGLDATNAFGI